MKKWPEFKWIINYVYPSMMLDDLYAVTIFDDFKTYEFDCIGPNGRVRKIVRYTEYEKEGYYNLGFGDFDPTTGEESDLSVTNNSDSKKVLRTVASTLYSFTDRYQDALVLASGSTQARTRLYRMGIDNHLEVIRKDFEVWGHHKGNWHRFTSGVEYDVFLVKRIL